MNPEAKIYVAGHRGMVGSAIVRHLHANGFTNTVVRRSAVCTGLGRRSLVRPGGLSKVLAWSLATLPRALRVRVMGLVMGGMTGHQRSLPS